jgi:hypothetical protein
MSGEKSGPISWDYDEVSDSYGDFLSRSAQSGVDVVSNLNEMRRQYMIELRLQELRAEIDSELDNLTEMSLQANRCGVSGGYEELVTMPDFDSMITVDDYELCLGQLRLQIREFRARVKEQFRNKIIEEKAGLKTLAEIASGQTTGVVTADSLIGAIENEAVMGRSSRELQMVSTYATKLKKKLREFEGQYESAGISSEVTALAEQLFSVTSAGKAQRLYDQISTQLKEESARAEESAQHAAKESERDKEKAAATMVGTLIVSTLEEMGYSVSGVEETCFVKDGEMFAQHEKFPGKAVKLTLDKDNASTLVAEPVLFTDDPSREYESEQIGQEFDRFWCSKAQLGRFRKGLSDKKLTVAFSETARKSGKRSKPAVLPVSAGNTKNYSEELRAKTQRLKKQRMRKR